MLCLGVVTAVISGTVVINEVANEEVFGEGLWWLAEDFVDDGKLESFLNNSPTKNHSTKIKKDIML